MIKRLYTTPSLINKISLPPSLWGVCCFVLILSSYKPAKAQLIINTSITTQDLVDNLLGCGSVASNITMTNCGAAAGTFTAFNTNLGIDSGVLITSGGAMNALGPNNSGSQSTDNLCPGYPPLTTLCGYPTFNASVLDFDVLLNTDTLKFKYVFASEEYMEWVGTIYNDVFALWISGPGITGSANMALVPGTPYPVTQANINCTIGNGTYYVCNDPVNFLCNASYNCPTSIGATTIQYDGFTVPLEAKIAVIPGQQYHLTFAVSDASDPIYDSGVFIEADFLNQYDVSFASDSINNFVNPFDSVVSAVEGCQPGIINLFIENQSNDTVFFPIMVGGTATSGTDYTALPDTIIFYPGDTMSSIFIGAFADGIPEGYETVIIYSLDPCNGLVTDSFVINIVDDFPFDVSNDTTICEHDSLVMSATYSPFYQYQWQPSTFVTCDTCATTTAFPDFATAYVVGVTLGNCTNYDTIEVSVTAVNPYAGLDQDLCHGDTTSLLAQGGVSYIWSPGTGLSDPTIPNPIAFPSVTTSYTVTAIGTNPLCEDVDTVIINVVPNLDGAAGVDTAVCPGKPVQLWGDGGDFYDWQPITWLNNNKSSTPICVPFVTTTYTVVISNVFDCTDTVEVTIEVYPDPVVTINQPYNIFIDETAQLFAHAGVGSSYSWEPDDDLTDGTIYNPIASPDSATTYYVVITTSEGCTYFDSTRVEVSYETFITMPNAFTPNGDGLNDELKIIMRGPAELNGFKIFDRWGTQVFFTKDINQGWNGTLRGKESEVGTYVYLIEGNDGNGQHFSKHGYFILLR